MKQALLSLRDLSLRTEYRKGRDDIAREFYLPCMDVANLYDRAVGFFNSAIYVIAWPSLKTFVAQPGRMRLICSPILPPDDIEAMESGYSERLEGANAEKMRDDIRYMLAAPYLHKPTVVLATLIALGVIDVRIAFMKKTSSHNRLFHDKLGLFQDSAGNTVAFKGSMNETWAGLSADGNLESVDVFLSWEHTREAERVAGHRAYFDALWGNECESEGVVVRPFPEIARSELISAADAARWPDLVDDICREIDAAKRFESEIKTTGSKKLRPHQMSALDAWEKRGRRGILEHATGSGKTYTATCAIRDSLNRREVPIVLVPSELLLEQWYEGLTNDLSDIRPRILRCGAGHAKWRTEGLVGPWTRPESDSPRIILSTIDSAATTDFLNAVRQGDHLFMVADEVHRVGSANRLLILDLETGPRLGLSATPARAGDPNGTARIFDYFEGVVPPPFTLKDAIESGTLTPYLYHVHTVNLTNDEQSKWNEKTAHIRRLVAQSSASERSDLMANARIKRLLIDRSRILKQAAGKAPIAAQIALAEFNPGDKWLIYCDDLAQLRAAKSELSRRGFDGIEYHSAMDGDRDQTLRLFESNGGLLVSIRCLDEGVDIPSITHALILASSRNPREYIQRRGRVLRTAPGKDVAHVHDVVVLPAVGSGEDTEDPSMNILVGEMIRSIEFAKWALNPSAITDLRRIAARYPKDFDALLNAGFEDDD